MKDHIASNAQTYAYYGGRVHGSYWADGLGIDGRGKVVPEWFAQRELGPLDWRQLGAELASQALLGDEFASSEDAAVSVRPLP